MAAAGGGVGGLEFNISGLATRDAIVCYAPSMLTTNGVWQGDDPLDYSLPLFILQLTLVIVTNRILMFLFKPFRQPKVIADIIGGILLGPSGLGRNPTLAAKLFPLRSILVLETMANIGLLFFLFLVGVEMDLTIMKRTGQKSLIIAICGMSLPFIVGASSSFLLKGKSNSISSGSFVVFLGIAQAVTAFPVLARILAELKLLNTELGQIAMSSAIINDMCAWVLLALAIAIDERDATQWASLGVILSSIAFVCFCIFVIRPVIFWVIRQTPEGENFKELHVCLVLAGVTVCGFITDAIGTHSIFGAFVYGLIIPNGPLGSSLVEKLEDFVSGLLLPLFFTTSGLRTKLQTIASSGTWILLFPLILLAFAAKVGGTFLVSMYYQMPAREGIALGLLMNAKGLIELVILNVGRDLKVLDEESFTIMVIVAVITTGIITPALMAFYKPGRHLVAYKRRSIQRTKPEAELQILACIHTPRNVPSSINLLEVSQPSRKSPICVYVLHLVELTGRASAMLIAHNTRKAGNPAQTRTQAQSDHIVHAFENFEQRANGVSIQPLTVISPYTTMHDDICNLAEDKQIAFILLPFHKQQTVDGGMEATNPAFRTINQNVLANAPCSVGILVDRGLGGSTRISAKNASYQVIVLFFGGADDREAISFARRMLHHPGTVLTVIRFIAGEHILEPSFHPSSNTEQKGLTVITDIEKSKQLDDELLNEFRSENRDNEAVIYVEKVVNNGEETLAAIRAIDNIHDLYIVGRGQNMPSPLTAGLNDWSECPELGTIGDILASPDFALSISVLVMQQYVGENVFGDGLDTPDTPSKISDILGFSGINQRLSRAEPHDVS